MLHTLVYPFLSFLCISPLFFLVLLSKEKILVSPFFYILIVEFFGIFLQTIVIVFIEDKGGQQNYYLLEGYNVILTFNLFLCVGYKLTNKTITANGKIIFLREKNKKKLSFFTVCTAFFLLALLFMELDLAKAIANGTISAKRFLYESGEKTSLGHLRVGTDILLVFGLVKFSRAVYQGNKKLLFLSLLIFLILTFIYVFLSSRMSILTLMLSSSIIYFHHKAGKFKSKDYLRLLVISLAVFSIILFVGTARKSQGGLESIYKVSALDTAFEQLASGRYFLTINKLSLVAEKIPEQYDYMYGKTFSPLLYFFVPKVLWQSKPNVRYGPEFAEKMYGIQTGSGVPPSFTAELYWNFGYLGVLFGALLLGVLTKAFFLSINKRDKVVGSVLSGGYIAFFLIPLVVSDFMGAAVGTIKFLFLFSLFNIVRR